MYVGFINTSKKPPLVAKVSAIMGQYYGFEIIYFTPEDINLNNGYVNGKKYSNNKWRPIKTKLPYLVDASSKSFNRNTREITAYLRENTVLTFDKKNTPNKEKLQKLLSHEKEFKHLVIPSEKLNSFYTLQTFLNEYSSVVVKPVSGMRGEDIYGISKQNDVYILSHKTEEFKLNYDKLYNFYENYLSGEKYMVQKMINSRTLDGAPFDCRIVVQKNRQGKWVIAKMFFRIGTGQKIVSNTSHGGSISDPKPFLKNNFGSQWKNIYQELKNIAVTIPYTFEMFKGTPTMDLGLDIGIDKNGDLFVFELNNGASVKRLTSESAILRLEYYQYLIETHPDLKKIKKNIRKKNVKKKNLKKERDFYKNEYDKLVKSKSWRLTMPLRKFSSFLKK